LTIKVCHHTYATTYEEQCRLLDKDNREFNDDSDRKVAQSTRCSATAEKQRVSYACLSTIIRYNLRGAMSFTDNRVTEKYNKM